MRRNADHVRRLSRLTPGDLAHEVLAGILQRPGRSMLTMLGTVLGVGSFVAILGITTTSANQIGEGFNALAATTVTVTDVGDPNSDLPPAMSYPTDARERITQLNGAIEAGMYFTPNVRPEPAIGATSPRAAGARGVSGVTLVAVDAGIFTVTGIHLVAGRLWDEFVQERGEPVAVLGADAARALGITRLDARPVVFVNNTAYTVIGVVAGFQRLPELSAAVMIPTSTALSAYGPPLHPGATMIIETQLGAAQLIAGQAALALRPDKPTLFTVTAPADPTTLRGIVTTQLNSLFLLLAAISLIIGAVGIANTTLVAVLERTPEIGLRRALGARPRHIATQFLTESATIGALGGLIGTSLGVVTTVTVAAARQWTPIIEPWTVIAATGLGAIVGTIAGLYPAFRASRVQPAVALRR